MQDETSWKWNCPWEVVRILEKWEIFLSFQSPFGGIFFSQSCLSSVLPLMFTQLIYFAIRTGFILSRSTLRAPLNLYLLSCLQKRPQGHQHFVLSQILWGPVLVGFVWFFFSLCLLYLPENWKINKPFFPSASYPANNEPEGRVFPVFMNRKCSIFLLLMGL